MSRKVSGWECQRCGRQFAIRKDAVSCCPPKRSVWWLCSSYIQHAHGTKSEADDCAAACLVCGHSKLVYLIEVFGGCQKRMSLDGCCGCNDFQPAAEGGAE